MSGRRTRVTGAFAARTRRAANRGLGSAESALLRRRPLRLSTPPIFILGAPRSGSTLLYQLLIGCLDVSYLSNLHCTLFGSPALTERLLRGRPRPPIAYESRYGGTSGLLAPSECGPYWYRFFRKSPQHVPLAEADPQQLGRLRASVSAFQAVARRPVVFKNLICSLRVAPIAVALPEAVYLVLHRDLLDNARSLLAARKSVTGSYERWWSAEPPGYETLLTLPVEQQVVGQVVGVDHAIDTGRERAGRDRFLDLRYEELCADPAATLRSVIEFAASHGCRVRQRAEPPAGFPRRPPARFDADLEARLERAAAAA